MAEWVAGLREWSWFWGSACHASGPDVTGGVVGTDGAKLIEEEATAVKVQTLTLNLVNAGEPEQSSAFWKVWYICEAEEFAVAAVLRLHSDQAVGMVSCPDRNGVWTGPTAAAADDWKANGRAEQERNPFEIGWHRK